MRVLVYEAATPTDNPPSNLGTTRDVHFKGSGTPQQCCQALLAQFPGQRVSFYRAADGVQGWEDVTEANVNALEGAVQIRRQLRVFQEGKQDHGMSL